MNFAQDKNNENKTEQINKDRNNIKFEIAVKLYNKGYSDEDVNSVLEIIEAAETEIQTVKDSLIGTNINPKGNPMEPLNNGVEKIRQIQQQMQQDLNNKLNELSIKYQK